jgi:hypothetical protein
MVADYVVANHVVVGHGGWPMVVSHILAVYMLDGHKLAGHMEASHMEVSHMVTGLAHGAWSNGCSHGSCIYSGFSLWTKLFLVCDTYIQGLYIFFLGI